MEDIFVEDDYGIEYILVRPVEWEDPKGRAKEAEVWPGKCNKCAENEKRNVQAVSLLRRV
jgi:hypothetical protein